MNTWLAPEKSTANGAGKSGARNANQPKQPYMCHSAAPACCAMTSPAPVFPG